MSPRVLVVNDEEQVSDVLVRSLADHGFIVASVPLGDDVITFVREHDVDTVLFDVGTTSEGVLENVRAIKVLSPLTQVIMLTRADMMDVAIRAMKLGAYDYVIKPGHREQIAEKIRNARQIKAAHEERIKRAEVDRLVMKREW